jgi:hypothetical protein
MLFKFILTVVVPMCSSTSCKTYCRCVNIQDIIIVLFQLTLTLIISFWDPEMHSTI